MSSAIRRAGMVLAAVAAVALCTPSPVAAANHPFLFSVYRFAEKPGLFEYFENPCGLTVDAGGNVYVSDYYHGDVDVFTSGGSLLTRLLDVDPIDGPCGLAVASSGRLFVNDYHRQVLGYTPAAFPLASKTAFGAGVAIDEADPTGVAYDPVGNRVLVDDRTSIAILDATDGTELGRIGVGTLEDAYGVAISSFPGSAGYVYVAEAADDTVKVFDPAVSLQTPVMSIDGRGTPQGHFPTLSDAALAVDDSDGHLYVAYNAQGDLYEHPRAWVAEFNAAGEHRGTLASPSPLWFGSPSGIAVDNSATATHGRVYVTTGNSEMGSAGGSEKLEESALYAFGPGVAGQRLEVTTAGDGSGTVGSAPAGIACPGACAAEFDAGAQVTLNAVPDPGSVFAGWSGDCAGSGKCTVALGAPASVGATFEPASSVGTAKAPAAASASTGSAAGSSGALGASDAPGSTAPPAARSRRQHRRLGGKSRHRRHRQAKSGGGRHRQARSGGGRGLAR